ncbi:MAG: T9SS type A sorting domain-containing protein [Bacteroidia bacterium]
MKNKKILILIIFFLSAFKMNVDAQIQNVIVENYYVSDTSDATDSTNYLDVPAYPTPFLPAGFKTYRVYVQLDSGYRIKKIYGTPNHPWKIMSTDIFFNNIDRASTGYFGYNINKSWFFGNPTIALDSWVTLGECGKVGSVLQKAVLKTEDTNGSLIGGITHNNGGTAHIPTGLIINNDPFAGIPVDTADGMIPDTTTYASFLNAGFGVVEMGRDTTVFGDTVVGSKFISTNAYLQQNTGVMGASDTSNKVLVAQLTTQGNLSFELNLQLISPTGASLNFVAVNQGPATTGDTAVSGVLKYPPACGCKDPNFLEYNANYSCSVPDSCHTRIVFGCMDTLACNYDPHANFHIQYLCCYPGNCNNRDIALVCPSISGDGGLHIYPNPAHDQMTLHFSAGTNNEVRYEIYNLFSLKVIEKDLGIRNGSIDEIVDVSDLTPGSYYVRIYAGSNIQSTTFMKQ